MQPVSNTLMGVAAEGIATSIEEQINEMGEWDMPATLWDIKVEDMPDGLLDFMMEHREDIRPDKTFTASIGREQSELLDIVAGDKPYGFGLAFAPEVVDYLEGHPYHAMKGRRAGPDVIGAALVTEGWDYCQEIKDTWKEKGHPGFTPSQDPNRREMRMVHLLWRDGTEVLVHRWRDTNETEVMVSGENECSLSGRVVAALRRYLDRDSGAKYETSAYTAARVVWALGLVHTARDMRDGLEAARKAGRNIADELAPKLVQLGLPDEAAKSFLSHPVEGMVLVGIHSDPNSVIERSPCALTGLATVFDEADLPDYSQAKDWYDFNQILGGIGPEVDSPEDIDLWERARLAELQRMREALGELEGIYAAKGKREIGGVPAPMVREKLEEFVTALEWYDAKMWAAEADDRLPTDEWLLDSLNKLLQDDTLTDQTVNLIKVMAGLEQS